MYRDGTRHSPVKNIFLITCLFRTSDNMKFLIIILLYVSFTSNLVSHGCNRTDIHTNFTTTGVHKSIRLELGIISVCVYDGDSICNVHINNGRGQTSFTTCKKASILDWAFDNFDNIVNETIVAEKILKMDIIHYPISFRC